MRTYRCQSAWKLVELDDQFRIFARSHCRTAIDLAAAPGGFAEVTLERMARLNTHAKHSSTAAAHTNAHQPLVVAVDQRPIEPLHGMVTLQENILNHGQLLEQLDGVLRPPPAMMAAHTDGLDAARTVEVVLHDGVSVVAGQRAFSVTYAQSQMTLSCLQLACRIFATYTARSGSSSAQVTPGSPSPSATSRRKPLPVFFVSKVMNCVHLSQVTAACRAFFSHVQVHKTAASKAESRERYLIAYGFKDGLWDGFENAQRTVARGGLPHTQSGRSSRGHSPNVFSLAPAIGDARAPGDIIWHCLGCGQTRIGTSACPVCTPHPRRQRK